MIQNAIRFADQIQSEFSIWAHIPGCFSGGGGQMVSLEVGRFAKYIQRMGVRIESYQVGGGSKKKVQTRREGVKIGRVRPDFYDRAREGLLGALRARMSERKRTKE